MVVEMLIYGLEDGYGELHGKGRAGNRSVIEEEKKVLTERLSRTEEIYQLLYHILQ
jgi:hypothetical protein